MTIHGKIALLFSVAAAAAAQDTTAAADPSNSGSGDYAITARQRFDWVVKSTIGPRNLAAGLVTAGWGTWRNSPPEFGPHWDGYAERYALRLPSSAAGNILEAGLGSLWGEDPRYFRAAGQPVAKRFGHVFASAFMARDAAGNVRPAYARYIAVSSTSFISDTWRPPSQRSAADTGIRIGLSMVSRIVGNAFSEFVPDVWKHHPQRAAPAQAAN